MAHQRICKDLGCLLIIGFDTPGNTYKHNTRKITKTLPVCLDCWNAAICVLGCCIIAVIPNVVRVLGLQVPHECAHWGFELESCCRRPLQVDFGWVALWEKKFHQAVVGLVHSLGQVSVKQVIVFVHKTLYPIQHLDKELNVSQLDRFSSFSFYLQYIGVFCLTHRIYSIFKLRFFKDLTDDIIFQAWCNTSLEFSDNTQV